MRFRNLDEAAEGCMHKHLQNFEVPVIMIAENICYIPYSTGFYELDDSLLKRDQYGLYKYSDLFNKRVLFKGEDAYSPKNEYYMLNIDTKSRIGACSEAQYELLKYINPPVVEMAVGQELQPTYHDVELKPVIIGTYHFFKMSETFIPKYIASPEYVKPLCGNVMIYQLIQEVAKKCGYDDIVYEKYAVKHAVHTRDYDGLVRDIKRRLTSHVKKFNTVKSKTYTFHELVNLFESYSQSDNCDFLNKSGVDLLFDMHGCKYKFDVTTYIANARNANLLRYSWEEYPDL